MKKFISIIALATVFAACSKENAPQIDPKEDVTPSSSKEVILFAEIPAMIDDTKAIADGSFSWVENDEIAIPISGGYAIFAFDPTQRNGQGAFTYTLTGSETFINGKAYYPASSRPSGDYSTNFANPDAARAGFMMEADYHVGDDHIDFTHKSSLIDLNFSNVPSFATSVQVKEGETVVATVALSSPSSSVEVKVPVTPNGSKTYTFSLMENSNIIKQVSKSGVTLTAGRYYKTPAISIGHVIRVQDSVSDWDSKALYFRNVNNSDEYKLFTTGDNYPYKFNTISANDHYVITPSEIPWMADGFPVVVSFRTNDDSKETHTDCVWLFRDITFTVPSERGMKTDYRIYPHGGSYSAPYARAYLTKEVTLKVDVSAISFGTPYLYISSGERQNNWNDKAEMTSEGNGIYSYTFPASYFNKNVLVVVSNSKYNGDQWQTNNYTCDFTAKDSYTIKLGDGGYGHNATVTQTATGNNIEVVEILGDAPGTAFTSPASISNSAYLSIPSTYYGQWIRVIFSDNGTNAKGDWNFIVNRDLDYTL